jgi:protein-tyrosine phosphatase
MELLFICTGNMCRSPLAERLAVVWAAQLLNGNADKVKIASAGLEAPVGQAMDPHSAEALARLGGDPTNVRARAFTPDMAENASLVLTMTRRQRRVVLESVPRGMRRTFTLLEAADLLKHADLRGLAQLPLSERARELGLRLDKARANRATTETDDIPDPIGRRPGVHDEIADTIADALRPLATVLFTGPRSRGAAEIDQRLGTRS